MAWFHFGMSRRPFGFVADAESYFPAATHEAARHDLAAAFDRGEGVALLDGPGGVGKTLTVLSWLGRLPAEVPRAWVSNVHAAMPADLLQAILFDLNLPYQGLGEQELRLAVTATLLDSVQAGRPTVLVIDEAQNLTPAALEELRLLGNVEGRRGKGLFALLAAGPGLREGLPAAFAQRLSTCCGLEPLTAGESRDYVRHHVTLAGGDADEVIGEEAVELLAAACGGIPRVLNRAAGLAVDLAAEAGADGVDAEAVVEALSRLGVAAEPEESAPPVVFAPPAPKGRQPAAGGPPKMKGSRRKSA